MGETKEAAGGQNRKKMGKISERRVNPNFHEKLERRVYPDGGSIAYVYSIECIEKLSDLISRINLCIIGQKDFALYTLYIQGFVFTAAK
jgi:hypothetical protein